MLDYGRIEDLEILSKMLKDKRSPRAKMEIEETIKKIVHQSAPITSLRERLIRATKHGDTYELKKIQSHIHAIRQRETDGREF